jgi:hypothetical protein
MIKHDIQVKSLLTVEEYLAFRQVCETVGASMSTRIRYLIKMDVYDMASEQLLSMDDLGHD